MRLLLVVLVLLTACRADLSHEVALVRDYAERYQPQIRSEKDEDVGDETLWPPFAFADVPDPKTLAAINKLASMGSHEHEKYILLIFLRHYRAQMEIAHQSYALADPLEKDPPNPLVKELCGLIDCGPPDAEVLFSGVEYSWIKKHPELQQYEPIRAEMERIHVVERQIEESLTEGVEQKSTSSNSLDLPQVKWGLMPQTARVCQLLRYAPLIIR